MNGEGSKGPEKGERKNPPPPFHPPFKRIRERLNDIIFCPLPPKKRREGRGIPLLVFSGKRKDRLVGLAKQDSLSALKIERKMNFVAEIQLCKGAWASLSQSGGRIAEIERDLGFLP